MFDWLEHDKKVSHSITLTYKELKKLESSLSMNLITAKSMKTSSDPIDRADYKVWEELHQKLCNLMWQIDEENPIRQIK
jgi:hypothetical protein